MKTARVRDQVEQEPVETEERPGLQLAVERHARAAEQRRHQRQRDADHAQDLAAAKADADHAGMNEPTRTRCRSARMKGTGYSARNSGIVSSDG